VGYAVAVPPQDGFSEFYLLTENEDGTLVADGYPSEFVGDESESVILGISNNEHKSTEYTVIAEIQRVEITESGTQATTNPSADDSIETEIIDRERLGRLTTTLDHEETVHQSHELNPSMTGEDLRIQYLLFKNEPPANPTRENAYRSLRLWVDVFETGEDREVATT
jgi:Predicted membrane protein